MRCAQAIADWAERALRGRSSTRRPRCCRSTARARRCSPSPRPRRFQPPRPPHGHLAQSVLPDLRRRRAAGRRPPLLSQHAAGKRLPHGLVARAGRPVGKHQPGLRVLARQSHRQGDDAGRLAANCSHCPIGTASSSRPTSAIRKSISTKASRRSARSPPRSSWARGFKNLVVFNSLVQALQRARHALRHGGGRRRDPEEIPALPHLSRQRDESGGAGTPASPPGDDEAHVVENRRLYAEKFAAVMPHAEGRAAFDAPDAAFYLWARVPGGDDADVRARPVCTNTRHRAARQLSRARRRRRQPGQGFVRIALVDSLATPASRRRQRIADFSKSLTPHA